MVVGIQTAKNRLISNVAFRFGHSLTLHARLLCLVTIFPTALLTQFLTSVSQLATIFSPSQGLIHKVHGQQEGQHFCQ